MCKGVKIQKIQEYYFKRKLFKINFKIKLILKQSKYKYNNIIRDAEKYYLP